MRRLVLAFVLCPLVFGCGSDSPSQPSPSPQPSGPTRIIAISGSLSFGDVVLGTVAERKITIRNTGSQELKISAVTLPPQFGSDWLEWRSGKIAPNAETSVTVYFVPDAPRSYNGNLTFAADHTSGANTLAVSGAGVLSPGPTSDRIVDPEVVQNILTHNQGSTMGGKRVGSIARWELPLPVYLEPQLESERGYVIQALDYLQANAGITYTFVSANTDPRVTVTTGSLGGNAGAQGGINSVFSNNQARRGTITIGTQNVPCPSGDCMNMYRHEFFHVLGINGHLSYPPQVVYVPGGFYPFKELAVLRSLYSLPHGATVNPDGTWR